MRYRPVLLTIVLLGFSTASFGQSRPEYIQFRPGDVKGALYRPDTGPSPHVGILVMHRTANVMGSLTNRELASRGFLVLAMNPRFDNNEASVLWEDIALDVKSGIEFLRKQPNITTVLLLGGSGGGPTFAFYQAVAEQGPSYCQGPNKLSPCGDQLVGLPKADGIIFRDAHPGNSVNAVRHINPAVMDESDPNRIDPDLDPFNPANGFNPNGPSDYSEEFRQRYFRAQAARLNRLIDVALGRLNRLKDGDDDVFLVPRGIGAHLWYLDPGVQPGTVSPRKLLKNDGTVVTQIVETVRVADPDLARANGTFREGTRLLTLRSFLSANAVRATDSRDGIDWCSSNNSTPCALRSITVPVLITAMGGFAFIRDNEIHYEVAASADKDFIVIDGASHGITPCTACESFPGQYSNTVKNFFDYVGKWIQERF